jgi:signal peptidase I
VNGKKRFIEEHEVPKSRRERRLEQRRRKWQSRWASLREALVTTFVTLVAIRKKSLLEYEVPKSRRELRRDRQRRKWLRGWRGGFREFVVTILVAAGVVFGVVRPFVVEAYRIPSASMVPTLQIGDRVLANKFIYRLTKPKRGDIVVFDGVEGSEDTLIKRVVGVGGDRIRVKGDTLYVNGEAQEEPYVNKKIPSGDSYPMERVPRGYIFVMGDNRGNSADSRVFGPVPLGNVEGEAFLRFWPPTKIGPL